MTNVYEDEFYTVEEYRERIRELEEEIEEIGLADIDRISELAALANALACECELVTGERA